MDNNFYKHINKEPPTEQPEKRLKGIGGKQKNGNDPDYQILFESAPGIFLVLSPDLKIVAVSRDYLNATKTTKNEIVGREIFDVIPDNPKTPHITTVAEMKASLNSVLQNKTAVTGAVQRHDIRRPKSEGKGFEKRFWRPSNSPVIGENNEVKYIIHSVEDITELILLKKKEKRAAELIIANKELAFQNDEKEKRAAELLIANKELAFQSDEKEKRAAELLIADEELAFQSDEKEKRAAELLIANEELAFQSDEKEKRAAELLIADKELAFQNKEKERQAIQTDALKEQNIELEIQKKLLAKASEYKSDFLSNMSHELRTPLNAIVGFSDLALKTKLNLRQKNYLSKIKISSHTLLGLISDILDLSKIEAGKLELEITTFNLERVLQNAVDQVNAKSQAKGLELKVFIDEDVPVSLNGDPLRLGQVLVNLTGNAVKFTEKGEIVIRVKLLERDGVNALIQFSVKDTGIGLSEEQIKKLFQPFAQADTSTTRKYGGTGLGLSISQNLVSLMQGDIWVESELGAGSTFFFTTRIKVADKERFRHFEDAAQKLGMKVLVVGDKEFNRDVIGSMLTDMNLDVTMSSTGEDAITILEKMKEEYVYDLIIMDWKLPGMDGIEASKHIKRMFASGKTPAIIMIAAYSSEGAQEKAEQSGIVEAVLYKPVNPSILFNTIIHVCGKSGFQQISADSEKKKDAEPLPRLRGTRVLLVEDNEINREMAQEILKQAGLAVTTANNGREAVDKVKANPYDVVLMDIQMPIMDGYDATRELRKDPVFADLPIIAMTANASFSDQEKCLQAGMNDHVAKPIDTMQLFLKIAHWTNKEQKNILKKAESDVSAPYESTKKAVAIHDETILDFAGIDVQAGLGRLGGNQKLYSKLLVKFSTNYKNAIKEIRYAVGQGDLKAAGMLVHSIKGVAGNIGAQDVYLNAGALEGALRAKRLDNLEQMIEPFEKALEQAFTSISSMDTNVDEMQSSHSGEADLVLLKPMVVKLEKLLHSNDLDAAASVDEFAGRAERTFFAEKAKVMKNYVARFDYKSASDILAEIRNSIEGGAGK